MADPFSIAAGAIAVAATGAELVDKLHSFVDRYRNADKYLRPIVHDVEVTSAVLDQVGAFLQTEDVRTLCQAKLLESTQNALKGCQTAFRELEAYIHGVVRVKKDGSRGVSPWDKVFWKDRQKDIKAKEARLERYKSSLDLVVGVLNLISSTK